MGQIQSGSGLDCMARGGNAGVVCNSRATFCQISQNLGSLQRHQTGLRPRAPRRVRGPSPLPAGNPRRCWASGRSGGQAACPRRSGGSGHRNRRLGVRPGAVSRLCSASNRGRWSRSGQNAGRSGAVGLETSERFPTKALAQVENLTAVARLALARARRRVSALLTGRVRRD